MAKEYPKTYPSTTVMAGLAGTSSDTAPEPFEGCLVVNNGLTQIWAYDPDNAPTGSDVAAGTGRIFLSPHSPSDTSAANQLLIKSAVEAGTAKSEQVRAAVDALLEPIGTDAYGADGVKYAKIRSGATVGWLASGETDLGNLLTSPPAGWPAEIDVSFTEGKEYFTVTARTATTGVSGYGVGHLLRYMTGGVQGAPITQWRNRTDGSEEIMVSPPNTAHIRKVESDSYVIPAAVSLTDGLHLPLWDGNCLLGGVADASGCTVEVHQINEGAPAKISTFVLGANESFEAGFDGASHQKILVRTNGGALTAYWNQLANVEYAAPGSGALADATPVEHDMTGCALPRTVTLDPGASSPIAVEMKIGGGAYRAMAGSPFASAEVLRIETPGVTSLRFTRDSGAAVDGAWRVA